MGREGEVAGKVDAKVAHRTLSRDQHVRAHLKLKRGVVSDGVSVVVLRGIITLPASTDLRCCDGTLAG